MVNDSVIALPAINQLYTSRFGTTTHQTFFLECVRKWQVVILSGK